MTTQPQAAQLDRGHLLRVLGVTFGVAVVVGGVIGQGILRTPGVVAEGVQNPTIIIALWCVAGLVAWIDAMSTVELAASIRKTGGPYIFARRAFGSLTGLAVGVCDWLGNMGGIAFIAVVFGEYLHRLGVATSVPIGVLAPAEIRKILQGGAAICAEAGIPVAGGHSIDAPEPIYGLAVIGLARPEEIRRNDGARPGDALILTKGLGVGIYSAAIKKGALDAAGYAEMIASTTLLNRIGTELAADPAVHAITDVTCFGVLGHGLEMARGSGARLRLEAGALPFLAQAEALAEAGFVTGASGRNWASYGAEAALPEGLPDWRRALLADPQRSGGLLVAVAPEAAEATLNHIRAAGYPRAARIGTVEAGTPGITVA